MDLKSVKKSNENVQVILTVKGEKMSKDLYGVREKFLKELRKQGYVTEDTCVMKDGYSEDGEQLYAIFFDNSEQKYKAFNAIYGRAK